VRPPQPIPVLVSITTGDPTIAKPTTPQPPVKDGPRINEEITVPRVRVVGVDGEQLGILPIGEARRTAMEQGLDLVEVAGTADPPVCKILDYGKFKYESQKKKNEARKKQRVIEVKEIKMRPGIDDHDYNVKIGHMRRFLDEGDKVKVTIRFRGRELAHQDLGLKVLDRVREELDVLAKVEQFPKVEGRQMIMVIAPR